MAVTIPTNASTRGVTTLQERVERERAISDRLFGWLDGRAITLDGMAGKIRYEWRITHDPLCWIATDYDLVISLTWSERLDGICRSFGARWCKDCRRYCHHTELACPCCERLETDAEQLDNA